MKNIKTLVESSKSFEDIVGYLTEASNRTPTNFFALPVVNMYSTVAVYRGDGSQEHTLNIFIDMKDSYSEREWKQHESDFKKCKKQLEQLEKKLFKTSKLGGGHSRDLDYFSSSVRPLEDIEKLKKYLAKR